MQITATSTGLVVGLVVALLGAPLSPLVQEAAAVTPLPSLAQAVEAAPAVSDLGVCDGLQVLLDLELGLCTHGADEPPAAATHGASAKGAPVPRRAATCIGDGRSGQRVEVLHVHRAGTSAASSSLRGAMVGWSQQVEWTVHASARRFGGDRRIRWHTENCRLQVVSRTVSAAALADFGTMIKELRDQGLNRRDRTYLLFVDATAYCGIATAPRDDRASSNRADTTTGYARVDRPCWDLGDRGYHSIAAHELMHTLGAVQASAPNGTRGAHCTDDHDLLCYDDGSGEAVRTVCRDKNSRTSGAGDANDRLLDCRGDDYFHPSPRAGTYLDRHWNTADSARLHDPNAPKAPTGGSSSGGSSSGGGSDRPAGSRPSPTANPMGYVWHVVFG